MRAAKIKTHCSTPPSSVNFIFCLETDKYMCFQTVSVVPNRRQKLILIYKCRLNSPSPRLFSPSESLHSYQTTGQLNTCITFLLNIIVYIPFVYLLKPDHEYKKTNSESKKGSGLLTNVVTSLLHLQGKLFLLFLKCACYCYDPVGTRFSNQRSFIVQKKH